MTDTSHFDRRGSTYDADQVHRRIVEYLVDTVEIRPGSRVLDVATGTGSAALRAAGRLGVSGEVLGIDTSLGMLAEARRKAEAAGIKNVSFMQGDAERMNLPSGSFDVILCASAVVLMNDIPSALRRWYELLKEGGTIGFGRSSETLRHLAASCESSGKSEHPFVV